MRELRPGVFTATFGKLIASERAASRAVLSAIAEVIEKQAKINVSNGRHAYGTPTTARPGEGPAVISGNLRKSITRTSPMPTVLGWECKVGTAGGHYPPYGKRRTPSSKYGKYLETGLKNGTKYPWLRPAAKHGTGAPALVIYRRYYGNAFKF